KLNVLRLVSAHVVVHQPKTVWSRQPVILNPLDDRTRTISNTRNCYTNLTHSLFLLRSKNHPCVLVRGRIHTSPTHSILKIRATLPFFSKPLFCNNLAGNEKLAHLPNAISTLHFLPSCRCSVEESRGEKKWGLLSRYNQPASPCILQSSLRKPF